MKVMKAKNIESKIIRFDPNNQRKKIEKQKSKETNPKSTRNKECGIIFRKPIIYPPEERIQKDCPICEITIKNIKSPECSKEESKTEERCNTQSPMIKTDLINSNGVTKYSFRNSHSDIGKVNLYNYQFNYYQKRVIPKSKNESSSKRTPERNFDEISIHNWSGMITPCREINYDFKTEKNDKSESNGENHHEQIYSTEHREFEVFGNKNENQSFERIETDQLEIFANEDYPEEKLRGFPRNEKELLLKRNKKVDLNESESEKSSEEAQKFENNRYGNESSKKPKSYCQSISESLAFKNEKLEINTHTSGDEQNEQQNYICQKQKKNGQYYYNEKGQDEPNGIQTKFKTEVKQTMLTPSFLILSNYKKSNYEKKINLSRHPLENQKCDINNSIVNTTNAVNNKKAEKSFLKVITSNRGKMRFSSPPQIFTKEETLHNSLYSLKGRQKYSASVICPANKFPCNKSLGSAIISYLKK